MPTADCRARLRAWLREHPDATRTDVAAAMGITRRQALADLTAIGAEVIVHPMPLVATWRLPESAPWCVRIPGRSGAWAYLLTSTGTRAADAAACFDRQEEAEGLLSDVRQHIAYRAPELLPIDFARRLEQAEVIPLPEGVKPWGGS